MMVFIGKASLCGPYFSLVKSCILPRYTDTYIYIYTYIYMCLFPNRQCLDIYIEHGKQNMSIVLDSAAAQKQVGGCRRVCDCFFSLAWPAKPAACVDEGVE